MSWALDKARRGEPVSDADKAAEITSAEEAKGWIDQAVKDGQEARAQLGRDRYWQLAGALR